MNNAKLTTVLLLVCSIAIGSESDVTSISSMDVLQWDKVAEGVWKASIGKKELASMDYAGPPKLKALSEMGAAEFPLDRNATRGQVNASGANVRLPLATMPLSPTSINSLVASWTSWRNRANWKTLLSYSPPTTESCWEPTDCTARTSRLTRRSTISRLS